MGGINNPVWPFYFADPFVWQHGNKYFAVGTGPVAERKTAQEADFTTYNINGSHLAFPLLVSTNLVDWKFHGGALLAHPSTHGGMFWAPEVAESDGKFYLYYSVAVEGLKHQLRVAVSAVPQ